MWRVVDPVKPLEGMRRMKGFRGNEIHVPIALEGYGARGVGGLFRLLLRTAWPFRRRIARVIEP